jgi:hypothetical protein
MCHPVRWAVPAAVALAAWAGCAPATRPIATAEIEAIARRYVVLAFQLARHDPHYVDAYYGPPEWKAEGERDSLPAATLAAAADSLALRLASSPAADPAQAPRARFLRRHLAALAVRARLAAGDTLDFAGEARALYDVAVTPLADGRLTAALAEIDSLLPGDGPLPERYRRFRSRFEVPAARLDTVMRAAMAEARRRTLAHIPLPDSESVAVEYVRGQPWSAYNWYQGGYRSRIQINVDQPLMVDRAVDLACHEGYPGHHVLNVLNERETVRRREWREFALFPLYGPVAVVAEGTARLAPEVAFPGAELEEFERTVLFPLAGIDTSLYRRHARIRAAMDSLEFAGIENGRRYLDGAIDRTEAVRRGVRFALHDSLRAERHVRFLERYRSYIVTYGLGTRLVRPWLEVNGGAGPDGRWRAFRDLLSTPHLPEDLRSGNR